ERMLSRAQREVSALDRIAVTTGPGSFTGLRVGIAAARGIALAAGKQAIGLSTLAAFAAPFIAADDTLPVVVAIEARHDHVYLQVFGPGGRTVVVPHVAPLREALCVSTIGAPRITGTAANKLAASWPARPRPGGGRTPRRAGHLGPLPVAGGARPGPPAPATDTSQKPLSLRDPGAHPKDAVQWARR